jgi:hypothetical protein
VHRPIRTNPLLIVVALLLTLSHVCALPGHADGEPAAPHHDTREAAPDRDHHDPAPTGDASHLESCEALRSAPTYVGVAPVALHVARSMPMPVIRLGLAHRRPAPAATASPPLFLLHAALLI